MLKKSMLLALAGAFISMNLAAIADPIDEQQKDLESELAVAKSHRQISSSQAGEVDKGLKEFSKLKRRLRDSHNGVLTSEDDAQLNKALNLVSQKFTTMKKHVTTPSADK